MQSQLRETLQERLRYLADTVGTVTKLAEIMGVNRAQMSRYINGSSIPRAELLAEFAQNLDMPLDWFFTPGDVEQTLSELRFGTSLSTMIRHRRFRLTEEFMPTGFYLFWKQLFTKPDQYECLLAKATYKDGVHNLKMNMTRVCARYNDAKNTLEHSKYCTSILFSGANDLNMLSLDDINTTVVIGSMSKLSLSMNGIYNDAIFAGTFFCKKDLPKSHLGYISRMPGNEAQTRRLLVRGALMKVPDTPKDILEAGRQCGRFHRSDLPEDAHEILQSIDVKKHELEMSF